MSAVAVIPFQSHTGIAHVLTTNPETVIEEHVVWKEISFAVKPHVLEFSN